MRALRAEFGDTADVAALEAVHTGAWFTRRWGGSAPATWNRRPSAEALARWQERNDPARRR